MHCTCVWMRGKLNGPRLDPSIGCHSGKGCLSLDAMPFISLEMETWNERTVKELERIDSETKWGDSQCLGSDIPAELRGQVVRDWEWLRDETAPMICK
jgi:hypothetical protein